MRGQNKPSTGNEKSGNGIQKVSVEHFITRRKSIFGKHQIDREGCQKGCQKEKLTAKMLNLKFCKIIFLCTFAPIKN